ncbi:hypothetical protein ALT717_90177 [Alteromonas macleodii]
MTASLHLPPYYLLEVCKVNAHDLYQYPDMYMYIKLFRVDIEPFYVSNKVRFT